MQLSLFTLALAVAAGVGAQSVDTYDPVNDFCRRFSHSTAVVGESLYITGGKLNLQGRGPRNYTNTRLLSHDLSTVISPKTKEDLGMPPLLTNLTKPLQVPSVVGGALWADQANGRLFMYGGEWPPGGQPDIMEGWKYDTYEDKWEKYPVDDKVTRTSYGAGTVVESTGMAYWLGGWMGEQNNFGWGGPKMASPKLLEYDMVNDVWSNRTEAPGGYGRAEGALFWLPVGDKGLLIHFGGVESPDGSEALAQSVDMNRIDIIDTANGKVYQQNATGTTPERRRRFCGGVASAKDGSSHNIYIYGGMGFGNQTTGFDDFYILSIPTFTWVRVYPDHVRKKNEAYFPHYDLSCNVVNGGSQMLIIGGEFPLDPEVKTCDAEGVTGVHNAYLGKNSKEKGYWALFDPELTGYEVPTEVLDVIGGNRFGGADKTHPENDLDFDLSVLMYRSYSAPARKPTRTPPAGASLPSSSATPEPKKNINKLLIIILPTVLGVAAILGIILFFLHRRRRQNAETHAAAAAAAAAHTAAQNAAESKAPPTPLSPTMTDAGHYPYGSTYAPTEHTYHGAASTRVNSPGPVELGGGAPTPAPLSLWPAPAEAPEGTVAYGLEQQVHNHGQGQYGGAVSPQGTVGPFSTFHDNAYPQAQGQGMGQAQSPVYEQPPPPMQPQPVYGYPTQQPPPQQQGEYPTQHPQQLQPGMAPGPGQQGEKFGEGPR